MQQHLIRKQVLELRFSATDDAVGLQEEVRLAFVGRAMQAMDRVLSSLMPDDVIARWERLELDLGPIRREALEETLAERLVEGLQATLARGLEQHTDKPVRSPARLVTQRGSRLEVLRALLRDGSPPWWCEAASDRDLEPLIVRLMADDPGGLVHVLRSGDLPHAAARLALQLSGQATRLLLWLLEPQAAERTWQAAEQWIAVLEGCPELVPDQASPVALVRGIAVSRALEGGMDRREVFSAAVMQWLFARNVVPWVQAVEVLRRKSADLLDNNSPVRRFLRRENLLPRQVRDRYAGEEAAWEHARGVQHSTATVAEVGPQSPRSTRASASGEMKMDAREQAAAPHELSRQSRQRLAMPPARAAAGEPMPAATDRMHARLDRAGLEPMPHSVPVEPERIAWIAQDAGRETGPDSAQYVGNAGLVLLWPYLDKLFAAVGLTQRREFASRHHAARGALLLHYLATGHAAAPEAELLLNKLLVGLAIEEPLPREVELEPQEREECEALLEAVITHWSALKRTSSAGLRSSFLQRAGRLAHQEQGWQLTVQRTGYDVLLESLPWGIGFVLLPWMRQPLFVEW